MAIDIRATATGVRITVHVQPKATHTEIVGAHGDALKIRLAAPPVDGAANDELIRFLAQQLAISRSALQLISGATNRRKVINIDGLTLPEVLRALGLA